MKLNIITKNDIRFNSLWNKLRESDPLGFPFYTTLDIEYSKEYSRESKFEDLSFLIEESGIPILGAILAKRTNPNGSIELSAFGRPIYYLNNSTAEISKIENAESIFKKRLDEIITENNFEEIFFENLNSTLSFLGQYLLQNGASSYPRFIQIIDLTRPERELQLEIRKSYRNLINWGEKNIERKILRSDNVKTEDMEAFRKLHIETSGKETRSEKTWQYQMEMIKKNEAFGVLGFLNNELVSAALFIISPKYCYYGVAVSKRDSFDKPLGHAILWTAILEAKKLGCNIFETGEQFYPNSGQTKPTQKDLGISTFKRGFGGKIVVREKITWDKNQIN